MMRLPKPGTYGTHKHICNLMPREALGRLAILKLPTSQNPPPLDPLALKKNKHNRPELTLEQPKDKGEGLGQASNL